MNYQLICIYIYLVMFLPLKSEEKESFIYERNNLDYVDVGKLLRLEEEDSLILNVFLQRCSPVKHANRVYLRKIGKNGEVVRSWSLLIKKNVNGRWELVKTKNNSISIDKSFEVFYR